MIRERQSASRQTLISEILVIVLVTSSYAARNATESDGVQFVLVPGDLRIYLAAPSGVFVARLSAINTRHSLSQPLYNIVAGEGDDSQYFSVDQTSGNLTTRRYIDRSVGSSYNISVLASTRMDRTRINLTILVSEYNRFPPVFDLVQYTINLDLMTPVNETIITVHATDRDVQPYNANIAYAIQSGGLLSIDRVSGEVTLRKKLSENENLVSTLFAIDGGSPVRVTKAKLTIVVKTISAPVDVVAQKTNLDFISLCWKKPIGGEPLGYVLFLRMMESKSEGISSQDKQESPPVLVEESTRNITVDMLHDSKAANEQICHILNDLEYSKEYDVRIAGWNTKEIGILTVPISFKTYENRTVCPVAQDVDSCSCMPGFYGTGCMLYDPCLASERTCENGGSCISDERFTLSCKCVDGFIGDNCEVFDPCYVSPCLNGLCKIIDTSNYVCECYTGHDCATAAKKNFAKSHLTAMAVEVMGRTLEDATKDPYLIDAALFVSTASQVQEMLAYAYEDIHIAQSMINIISNLMNVNESVLEDHMFSRNQSITYSLVETIEIFITNTKIERKSNLSMNSPNLAIEASVIGLENSEVNFQQGITFSPKHTKAMIPHDGFPDTVSKGTEETNNVSINIPKEALFMAGASNTQARVYFVSFKNSKLFRSTHASKAALANSDAPVLIASISNVTVRNLKDTVSYIFPNDHVGQKQTCVYWSQDSQEWRQEGLTTNQGDENIISCESIHLTAFSVLLDPDPDNVISEQHQMVLSIISYVGSACSIVGLILTIITYSMFRCLNRDRSAKILLNLCVSLMMMNISFVLIAVEQHLHVADLCMAIAMATHYFVLTSLAWMLVEATNMYQLLITVFATTETRFMLKRMLCAWGLPFLVVALTAVSDISSYQAEDEKGCLLTPKHPYAYYFAYLGPSCVILAVNCAVFVLVIRTVFQRRIARNVPVVSDRTTTMAQVRGAITVMTLLGVAWVFGALAMGHFKLAFQYVFCIFNSLQGFIIFVVRCAQYSEARLAWTTLFRTGNLKRYRGVLPTSSSRHTSSSFSHSAKSTESHSILSLWHQIFSKKNEEKNKSQSFSNFNLRNNFGNQQLTILPLKELHDVSSDSSNQDKKDESLPRKSSLFVTELQLQSSLPFSNVDKVYADTDSDSLRSKQLSFNHFNRQENLSLDNINIAWSQDSLRKMEGEITSWQFMRVASPKKKSGANKSSKYRNSKHLKSKGSVTKTV